MNYLETMPSIVAFIPKETQPAKPGTLGFIVGQLWAELKVVSTFEKPKSSRKASVMQKEKERLSWQYAILQDIRDHEQLRVIQEAGTPIEIPENIAGVMEIPLFDSRAHDMPVREVARILRDRREFARMKLDPKPRQYGNHFYSPESFAYAEDLLGRLEEAASGTMIT